jgi:putative Holliday junction resolvase
VSAALAMKRLLGIDFGRARIGLAISDELGLLAHPLETLPAGNGKESALRISMVVREKEIERVVVGLPRNMDGSLGEAANEALAFVEKLRAHLPCPVVTWDERLTTVAAHRALRDAGRTSRTTRGCVDQVAAQMILQGYLDQLQMRAEERLPQDLPPAE